MHDAEQCCRNFPFPRRLLATSFVISWNSSSAFTLLSLRHKQTGWSCLSLCQSHACFYSIWAHITQDVCHVYTVGNTAIHYIRPSIEGEGGGHHGQSASRGGSPLIDGGRMDEKNWGCTVQWLWDVFEGAHMCRDRAAVTWDPSLPALLWPLAACTRAWILSLLCQNSSDGRHMHTHSRSWSTPIFLISPQFVYFILLGLYLHKCCWICTLFSLKISADVVFTYNQYKMTHTHIALWVHYAITSCAAIVPDQLIIKPQLIQLVNLWPAILAGPQLLCLCKPLCNPPPPDLFMMCPTASPPTWTNDMLNFVHHVSAFQQRWCSFVSTAKWPLKYVKLLYGGCKNRQLNPCLLF